MVGLANSPNKHIFVFFLLTFFFGLYAILCNRKKKKIVFK